MITLFLTVASLLTSSRAAQNEDNLGINTRILQALLFHPLGLRKLPIQFPNHECSKSCKKRDWAQRVVVGGH